MFGTGYIWCSLRNLGTAESNNQTWRTEILKDYIDVCHRMPLDLHITKKVSLEGKEATKKHGQSSHHAVEFRLITKLPPISPQFYPL
jgi:hypothetical protein